MAWVFRRLIMNLFSPSPKTVCLPIFCSKILALKWQTRKLSKNLSRSIPGRRAGSDHFKRKSFFLYLSPTGQLVGFNHIIPEDIPGTNLSQAEAQLLAEDFLNTNTSWRDRKWERVDASSVTQPGSRIDHTFSWKALDYSVGGSELRYTVTIQGDRLGYMNHWVKTPETYLRNFSAQRNRANFFSNTAFLVGMAGLLFLCLILMSVESVDYWKPLFPALLGAGIRLASYLNYFPLFTRNYSTTQEYSLFWLENGALIFFSTIVTFILIYAAWAGGQTLARFVWPRQDRILERGPDRWQKFSLSAWRGLMIAGFHLGYIVCFHLITSRFFGWWSPISQGSASNIYATPFPFLEALDVGVNAALSEELLFRLAGISLVLWLTRKRWLALLLPGLLWAFAHLSYVSDPIYARGIELTIVAIFYGIIFLNFGLMTTIISHMSYNMIVSSVGLFLSSDPYYQFSGMVVLVILFSLLLPGLVVWAKKRLGGTVSTFPDLEILSATEADLPQLTGFPVKADWKTLLVDSQRKTLCLRSGDTVLGFSTGTLTPKGNVILDGVYILPAWRRAYLGSTLVGSLQEQFEAQGIENFYFYTEPEQKKTLSFLGSLFWRSDTLILKQEKVPSFRSTLVEPFVTWLRKERSHKSNEDEFEMVIPHAREM